MAPNAPTKTHTITRSYLAGWALPPHTWPEGELALHGFATRATATTQRQQLNRAVGTFNGIANPAAGTPVIEVQALVPESVAEPVPLVTTAL